MPKPQKIRIGIVGSEAAKFDTRTEDEARRIIQGLLPMASVVVSGGCHLGGIDIWAAEEGRAAGIAVVEYLPTVQEWSGFRVRNLKIVADSDLVVCITVARLPEGFKGMRFSGCYHCNTKGHVKSGGCWTVKQAIARGKVGRVEVIY